MEALVIAMTTALVQEGSSRNGFDGCMVVKQELVGRYDFGGGSDSDYGNDRKIVRK